MYEQIIGQINIVTLNTLINFIDTQFEYEYFHGTTDVKPYL